MSKKLKRKGLNKWWKVFIMTIGKEIKRMVERKLKGQKVKLVKRRSVWNVKPSAQKDLARCQADRGRNKTHYQNKNIWY